MSVLIDTTVVAHPATLAPIRLRAGDELPDWAIGLVGDHLLDQPAPPARAARAVGEEPPRGGAGSGAAEWAAFAVELGVEPAGPSRDAIIEQLVQLGLIAATPVE